MTRNFAFLATVAAIASVPQAAQASCSGNACSAFSTTATWSSSDKRVNTVLTNKDQAKAVHLKFCITVDGKCNSFDVTLPPHSNDTKSVSVSGGAAPPKFAVDVSSAEFPAGQGSSQGTAAAVQGSSQRPAAAAVNGVDTPYERITYFATEHVEPTLSKAVADLNKGRDLYQKLAPRVIQFTDGYQKVGSLAEIEAQIRTTVNANPTLRLEAGYAEGIARDIEILGETFRLLGELADAAARSLDVAENELHASWLRGTADQLIAEAEKERQRLALVIKTIGAADKVLKGEGTAVAVEAASSFAEEAATALFTNSLELVQEAQELQAKAKAISANDAAQSFKNAEKIFNDLHAHAGDLKPKLAKYKADHERAVKAAQGDFDKSNAKNSKGSFNFGNITALIAEAKAIKNLAAETKQATNAAREYMREFRSLKKDWMANQADDEKIMKQIVPDRPFKRCGTLVLWSRLYRVGQGHANPEEHAQKLMRRLGQTDLALSRVGFGAQHTQDPDLIRALREVFPPRGEGLRYRDYETRFIHVAALRPSALFSTHRA